MEIITILVMTGIMDDDDDDDADDDDADANKPGTWPWRPQRAGGRGGSEDEVWAKTLGQLPSHRDTVIIIRLLRTVVADSCG